MSNTNLKWSLQLDYSNLDTGAKKASSAFKTVSKEASSTSGSLSQADKQFKKTGDVASKAGNKIKRAFMGITSLIGIGAIFSTIAGSIDGAVSRLDTLNNYTNVMSNLGISADDANISVKMLNKGLDGLPTTLNDAVSSVQRFTSVNDNVIASTNMFLSLNNAILAGGAPMDQQRSALEQLSQAYAKGKPDMMEWRSAMSAMPAQMKQVALAMKFNNADELGEALRKGEVSMNDFMRTIAQLNTEGANGFQSFEDQARNSTGGVATSFANVKTAITRGLAEIMNAIGQSNISAFFRGIASAINTATAYVVAFINVMKVAIQTISTFFGRGKKQVDGVAKAVDGTSVSVGAMNSNIGQSADDLKGVGKEAKKTAKEMKKLTQLGIDELNIIKPAESADSGSAGSGAGGGVGGMGDLGDLGIAPDIDMSGITKAQEITDKFMEKWNKLKDLFVKNKVPIISVLSAIGAGIATAFVLGNIGAWTAGISSAIGWVQNFFLAVKNWGLLNTVFAGLGQAMGGLAAPAVAIVAVVMAVVGAIVQLWQTNEEFRDGIITAWEGIKDTLSLIWDTILAPIFESFVTMMMNVWEHGVKPLWDGWVDFVGSIVNAMTGLWTDTLKPFVDWFIVTFGPVLADIFKVVSGVIALVMSTIGQVIGATFTHIGIVFEGIIGVFKGVITFLTGVFTGDWTKAWEGVKQIFSSIVNTFKGIFQNVWNFIIGIFNAGGSIFGGIVDGITGVFTTIVNGLIGGINTIIAIPFNAINGLLNGIRNASFLGVSPFSGMWKENPLFVPKIPKFANGNIAYGTTLGIFGEYEGASRDPEVTTPLSKLKDMLPNGTDPAMIAELREQNRLLKQIVDKDTDVVMDGKKVGEGVDKRKAREARQKGMQPVGG